MPNVSNIQYNGTTYGIEGVTDATLTISGRAADAAAVGAALARGSGLTEEAKQALLACFAQVAWIGDDGQDYYDALEAALYPPFSDLFRFVLWDEDEAKAMDSASRSSGLGERTVVKLPSGTAWASTTLTPVKP